MIQVCPASLYTGYRDVRTVADAIAEIIDERAYEGYDSEGQSVT